MKKSFLAAALTTALSAASMIVFAPVASAGSCVRNTLTTGYRGPGTVVNKAASSRSTCHDLNLVRADDSSEYFWEMYAGFYRSSNGAWHVGTRGYVEVSDGMGELSPWIVLVSDVRAGTPMGVGSYYEGGDLVTVAH
jgi:hypothetical protein